jgi:hypothetical protein
MFSKNIYIIEHYVYKLKQKIYIINENRVFNIINHTDHRR